MLRNSQRWEQKHLEGHEAWAKKGKEQGNKSLACHFKPGENCKGDVLVAWWAQIKSLEGQVVHGSDVKVSAVSPAPTEILPASLGWLLEKNGTVFSSGIGLHLMLWSSALIAAQFARKFTQTSRVRDPQNCSFLSLLQKAAEVAEVVKPRTFTWIALAVLPKDGHGGSLTASEFSDGLMQKNSLKIRAWRYCFRIPGLSGRRESWSLGR